MKCPTCGVESSKVLYMGIPVRLCNDRNCNTVFGFWSWLMALVPFNGFFFVYEGSYLKAMYDWLRD